MSRQLGMASGGLFDTPLDSTDQKYLEGRMPFVGQKLEFDDGRIFRFVSSEADLTVGNVVAIATALATEIANALTAAAAGATQVVVNLTGIQLFGGTAGVLAADRLKEGYIMFTDDTGEGYCYKIKSNTVSTAVTVTTTLTLYDPLVAAIDTTTDCIIVGPTYRKVVQGTATLKSLGTCLRTITGATDVKEYFFWIQTRGPGIATGAGTVGVPLAAAASGAVADSAEAGSGAYDQIVGVGLGTTANGQAALWLQCE